MGDLNHIILVIRARSSYFVASIDINKVYIDLRDIFKYPIIEISSDVNFERILEFELIGFNFLKKCRES